MKNNNNYGIFHVFVDKFCCYCGRASNPDFATYVTGLDRQGRFVVVSVSVYGSDLIVTDGEGLYGLWRG